MLCVCCWCWCVCVLRVRVKMCLCTTMLKRTRNLIFRICLAFFLHHFLSPFFPNNILRRPYPLLRLLLLPTTTTTTTSIQYHMQTAPLESRALVHKNILANIANTNEALFPKSIAIWRVKMAARVFSVKCPMIN